MVVLGVGVVKVKEENEAAGWLKPWLAGGQLGQRWWLELTKGVF